MNNYSIAVEASALKQLLETAVIEYRTDKNNQQVIKSKKLTGAWVTCFKTQIEARENMQLSLKGKCYCKELLKASVI